MKLLHLLSAILLFGALTATAQKSALVPAMDRPVYFDVSPPLRDLIQAPNGPADRSWKDGVVKNYADPQPGDGVIRNDGAVQDYFGSVLADTTIVNVEGMHNLGGYVPPDTHGDVGLNHYFQVINCSYAIFNKSGNKIFGPYGNSTVWSGMPNNSNDGDAIVLFDEVANRWLFSQFSLPNGSSTAPFFQMIAVSQTPDPTGSWYRYMYQFSSMPDYPKFGIWPDGYYMTTNNFGPGSAGWVGNGAFAYDRAAMLAGDPDAVRISFNLPPGSDGFISLLPADCDGDFPAAGTPNYMMYVKNNGTQRLGIYEFHADFANPPASTFSNFASVTVTPFNTLGWGSGIPQLGSPQQLETLGDRLMYRLQYRKFNGYASMVANHSVSTGGRAGVRWYELRNTGTGWSIYQQSTYAPDNHSRWMGSIAQDSAGTISLGYSVSSPDIYPGIRYTGRLKNDPLNQMTIAERTIINGGGSQTGNWSGRSRWGDYSALSIDPAAPTTFWFTTEYYATTSSSSWTTRIASYTFDNVFSSAASVTPGVICGTDADSCQLHAYGYGGSGNYSYAWTSIPAGFTSTLQSPKVKPAATTKYISAISDGTLTRHDTTELKIVDAPTAFAGNDTIVCWYTSPVPINASATGYQRFLWGSLGDGHFTDPNALTTAYVPGIKDKTTGYADLKLIVWPLTPCLDKASDMMRIVLDPCTGIGEASHQGLQLAVGPNPTGGKAVFTVTGLSGRAEVTITSVAGRVVTRMVDIRGENGKWAQEVRLDGQPSGLYIVEVRQEDGSAARARLVLRAE